MLSILLLTGCSVVAFATTEQTAPESYNIEGIAADSIAPQTGGRLMFIPDSIAADVESVLRGYSNIVRDNSRLDPLDMIVIGNDTVPPIIKDRNLGRYDRGLFNYVFIPKGMWQLGVTASYGEFNARNFEMLDILSDLDMGLSAFSIKPYVSYFVRSNLSVGLRFGYSSAKGNLDSANVDFDEDMNFNLSGVSYRNESYAAAFFARNYIGLSRAGRFGVFNELELSFASGNSDFKRIFDDSPKTTHTTYTDIRLNFSPGLCVFIMDNVSFNISFGVFGFYLRNERQRTTTEKDPEYAETGNRLTSGANFRFNIFNINFGLGIHF